MYPHGKAIKGKGEGLLLIMGLTGSMYFHGKAIKGKGRGCSSMCILVIANERAGKGRGCVHVQSCGKVADERKGRGFMCPCDKLANEGKGRVPTRCW